MICWFNGAKDAGEERWDPRFDCQAEAVWHILLAEEAADLTMYPHRGVVACEDHVMNVYYSIAMRHRVGPYCSADVSRWNLMSNECQPAGTRRPAET